MNWFKKKITNNNIIKNIYKKFRIRRYLGLLLGLFILAFTFNVFFLSNNIVYGSVSGLAIIVKELIGFEPATFIFISSLVLLIISFFALGKEKTAMSILGTLLFPLFVKLTADINMYLDIDTSNLLLTAIFGGVLYGFGAGLVFKAGFTTGGTDILNQIASKYLKISMGKAMLMTDGLIVLAGGFVFGFTKFMYALIILYLIGVITDKVLLGISESKAFYITTSKDEEVRDYIINVLGHSVTIFNVKGGYSNDKKTMLLAVIPTKEYFILREGLREIDADAFFVVTDSYEVIGGE
ncbi:MAG: YitT family protein [Bacilli bacterium]